MFCMPAHLFNRLIIVVPMGLCVIMGAFNYDSMLKANGYKPVGVNISDE